MKTFTKHILLLALMLFGVAGAAWATRAPQKFTGPVDIYSLMDGDTLAPGFSLTYGHDQYDNIYFANGRYSANGTPQEGPYNGNLTDPELQGTSFTAGNIIFNYAQDGIDTLAPMVDMNTPGNAWVVSNFYQSVEGVELTLSGIEIVIDYPVQDADGNWTFTMPGANKVVKVTYKAEPGLAWVSGNDTLNNTTTTELYRGFDSAFFAGLQLRMNPAFAAHFGGDVTHLDIPTTWAEQSTLITPSDLPGFQPMTEAEAKAWTGVPATGTGRLLYAYNADNSEWTYLLYDGGYIDNYPSTYTLQRGDVYDLHISYGTEYYYTAAGSAPLRYVSSDPSVVTIDANGHAQAVGTGTATLYAFFDGDDDYQRDSAWFTVTIAEPATLTLQPNDYNMGTVSALIGNSRATWTTETWANLPTDQNLSPLTFGDITISTTGSMAINSSYNPGKLSFFVSMYDDAKTLTFSSEGGNFSRIEMTMISEYSQYNPSIIPADGWTFHGHTAVWEGDAPSVTVTSCSTYVDQITFSRGIDSIVVLDEAAGTYAVIPGATVQVVATAQDGNYVSAWSDNRQPGNYTSDTNTITVGESQTLTATFAQNPLLTLATSGQGSVSLDGVTYGTVYTFTFEHSGNSEDDRAITIPANRLPYDTTFSYNANITFADAYDQAGEGVSMITHGDDHHTVTVRISGPFEYGGYYSCELEGGDRDDWTISCTTGTGPVTPNGITKTGDNTYRVLPGTQLSVTATPGEGSYLAQWSDQTEPVEGNARLGGSHPFTMPSTDATLTATFNEIPVLTLASNNSEWGTVELDGVTPGPTTYDITIEGGDTYTNVSFPFHTTVFLHEGLEGVDALDQNPLSAEKNGNSADITISGPYGGARTIEYGYFYNEEPWDDVKTIFCTAVEGLPIMPEGVTYAGYGNYLVLPGTQLKVIATPDSAHYFVNWTDSAAVNSNIGDTNTLTMGTDDTELTANFALKPTLTLVHNDGGEMEAIVPQAEPVLLTTITPTSIDSYDETTPGAVNVILDGQLEYDNTNGWQAEYGVGYQGSVTVTANPGFSIDSCKFYVGEFSYTVTAAPFTVYPFCESSMQYVYTLPNAQGIYVGYYGVTRIEVYTATRPNVIASSTPNTYYVDYNTSVTVKATPSDTAYLVRFDQDADTNSNTAVEKTYGPLTAALTTAEATFNDKPVLTLAANDTSWGSVSVANGNEVENMSIGVGGSLYTGTHFTLAYTAHKDYTHGVAGFTIKENQDATLTATDGKVIRKVVLSNLTGNAYNESTTSSTGTIETERFGSTITINDVNATELVISNSYSSGVTATSVAVYYEGEELPAGVTQLTDSTYLVDYGTTLTVQADATALHHVANWVNEDSVAYPADSITYSAYFVTEPEPLFPALSTLTLTMTADTTTEALFGINSYDVAVTIAETEDLRGTVTISYTDINDVAHTVYAPDTVTVRGDTVATLVATAEYGYHFVRWTDTTGIVLGTLDTLRVTAAANVVAYFDTNAYEVRTLLTDASDGRESTFSGPDTVKHFTSGTVTAHAAYGYHLVNWTNAADSVLGTDTNLVVTPISDTTLYATFTKNVYYISVMVDTAQSYSRTTHTALYLENVSLPVIPKYGYHFVMWSDSVTANPRSITVTGNAVYHGLLAPNKYTVSATADSNRGTFAGTGSVDYLYNDTLRAIGNHGYRFDHWNDGSTENPRIVTVTKDTAFTAYFVIDQFTVTVKSADTTMGTAAGTATVDYGTEVTISATAKEHYHFVKWNDGNTNATRTVTANDDVTYTASFAPDSYTVTGLADQGQGSVTGSGSYAYLATATLTAVPACGYLFDHWSNQSTASTLTFQVTGPTTLTAYFRPTVVDTVTIHDTTVVEIHDTTVVAVDTMYIPVPDTTLVPVTVYDTTVVPVTEYDTTLVPVVINDTTIVPVVIIDSTLVPVIVPDTTLVPVTVYDTTTVPVTWYDTTVVPVTWYDTTHVPVTWYDTTVVPVTIVDTTLMPVVVPDTTFVPVTVYDTTIVPVTWYDTTHVDVTEYDTTHVDVTVVDSTLVPIHDTVIEYIEVHDTLWLVEYIYDTVYIHDTIIITGVDDVDVLDAKIYADHGEVVVEGANYERVMLFDAVGRLVAVKQDEGQIVRFGSLASGAYLVKIGNHPARRVVVIR